jgi:YHS domain-containing protein
MKTLPLVFSLFTFGFTIAQHNTNLNKHQNLKGQVAIQGYDPVAYFISAPTEGKKEISTKHNGAIYYFYTEDNKNLFVKNPSKYEPQYGGYCAYAIGENGEKVSINPKTFKIVNGKLYLFYNAYFTNTLKSWNKNEDELKREADENWINILNSGY